MSNDNVNTENPPETENPGEGTPEEKVVPPVDPALISEPESPEVPAPEEPAPELPLEGKKDQAAKVPWERKELDRKHAQLKAKDTQLAEKARENEELRALLQAKEKIQSESNAGEPSAPAPQRSQFGSQADFDAAVKQAASDQLAQIRYNDDLDTAYAAGKTTYGADWDYALENLRLAGGVDNDTMAVIVSTDNPAKVLHDLGKNPERLEQIMALPVHKRLAEVVKMSISAPKLKTVSSAAPPVEPLGGHSKGDPLELRDDLSDDEWFARNEKLEREKWNASRR